MSQKLSYQKYKALVEAQANQILDKLAFAATGDLDTNIEIPEGIEALTDLAIGISYLLDDMRVLLAEQQAVKGKLEEAVAEKTADLTATLAELQAAQQRYTQQAWHHYTSQSEDSSISTPELDESWLVAMAEAVEQKETIAYGGQESRIAIPLEYSNSLIGVLGFASDEVQEWEEEELLAVEGIVEQVGLALENQRLLDQTQQQLAELATINEIAKATSDQLSMDALMKAVGEALARAFDCWGVGIGLVDDSSRKVWFPYIQFEGVEDSAVPSGHSLDEPSLTTRIIRSRQPVLLDKEAIVLATKGPFRQLGPVPDSILGVPLLAGQRAIGVILLQRLDDHERRFVEADQRLLVTIARNVAVAVENARLFGQTEARAKQLEILSEIEVALSLAETEDEALTAILTNLPEISSQSCTLSFLHHTGENILLDVMSRWQRGQFLDVNSSDKFRQVSMNEEPTTSLWRNATGQVIYIEDVQKPLQATDEIRNQAAAQGWQAMVLLPLRSGRTVQALFGMTWEMPHAFSVSEKFIFDRLLEPLSAIVSSRRARIAQQAAFEEMESLYEASAQLNVAQNYDEIVNVLREYSIFGDEPVFVSLDYFLQHADAGELPETVEVLARYERADLPPLLEKVYRIDRFPTVSQLLEPSKIVVVEDLVNDPRVTKGYKEFFVDEMGARSAMFVPLVVGQQWIGLVNVFYPEARKFSVQELRRPMALAAQAAVATQSLRLLKNAQRRAQREQILREVTERVRTATDIDLIMKTAVQEVSRTLGRPTYITLTSKDERD